MWSRGHAVFPDFSNLFQASIKEVLYLSIAKRVSSQVY